MEKNCITQVNIPTVDNESIECDHMTGSECIVVNKYCKKLGNLDGETLDRFIERLCVKLSIMDNKIVLASKSGGGTTNEFSIPDWVEGTYPVGKIVAHNGGILRSEVAGNDSEPVQVSSVSSWEKTEIEPVDYYIDYLLTGDEGLQTNILYELETLPNLNITKGATAISANYHDEMINPKTILKGERVIYMLSESFTIVTALEDIPANTNISYLMSSASSALNPSPDAKFELNTAVMTSVALAQTCDTILSALNFYEEHGIQVALLGEEGEYVIKDCPLDKRSITYNGEDIEVFDFSSANVIADWKLLSEINTPTGVTTGLQENVDLHHSYTTTETQTGGTWIDGKPIYTITQLTVDAIPVDMETRFPDEVIGDYTVYKYTKTTL